MDFFQVIQDNTAPCNIAKKITDQEEYFDINSKPYHSIWCQAII